MAKPSKKTKRKRERALAKAGPLLRADLALGAWVARNPVLGRLAPLAELADEPPLAILSAAIAGAGLARRDGRLVRTGGRMLAALAAATAAKSVGKRLVGRTRPRRLLRRGRHEILAPGPYTRPWKSFPSGHAANAVAVAQAFARHHPRWRTQAIAAAIAIAALKVPKGDHWPSDILAGALLGWGAEALLPDAAS